jgi:uncharacterized protein YvpB
MSRFRRAIIGFMVIANLGIYSAFALWLMVDGGLPPLPAAEVAEALGVATSAFAPASATPPLPATSVPAPLPGGSPTPGWTPPPILAPLPTAAATNPPGAVEAPTETVPIYNEAGPSVGQAPATLPESARVSGVVGHRQALPLSCESRSAADWAAFFGVAVDELAFLGSLPLSDDPDHGFVGDVNGEWGSLPPGAYGVHAAPVARLLRSYGLPAESRRYMTWDNLRAEIAAGRPVIVWVTGHVEAGQGEVYTAGDGRRTIVARFEHTVIVIGYDADSVLVVDGANTYRRSLERFLASWGALRNMAVTAGP